ncbi:hypothetical protein [Pseudomonas sp. Z2-11]
MDGINGARLHYATNLKATASPLEPTDKVGASPRSEVQPGALSGNTTTRLSPMAQLLSDAAARAAERDASNDRAGLADIARRATQDFFIPYVAKNKEIRDAEVPPSDDPQRLDQAQQATNFLNKKGGNPFANLSIEQLTLIIYDDSGDFTHNERRVAWETYSDAHGAWTFTVTNKLMDEDKTPETIRDVLNYYKSLPPIQEAQMLGDYEADFTQQIKSAELAKARRLSGSDDGMPPWQSLLELMLAQQQKDKPETPATDA